MVQRSMGRIYMPSFQTKGLMVLLVSGNNFGIIPPNCMAGLASMFGESQVFFFTKKDYFLVLL